MTAVITGATRGIGKAIAERFAVAGFNLITTSRSSTDLMLLKNELEKLYKIKVYFKAANFQKKHDVIVFGEFVKQTTPKIDVLVHNVGHYLNGKLFDESADKLLEQIQINLLSAHYLTSSLIEIFKLQRSGHIFTIGSILSKNIREEAALYTISKHALYTWHQLLFQELRNYDVKATIVLPSSTFTSSWDGIKIKSDELIQPEMIAESIYDAFNINGSAIIDELSIKTISKNYD